MGNEKELEYLRTSLKEAEDIQTELDRRIYHLRTLYDVSSDIFGSVEYDVILRNFLLMTMGNFGVGEGFILALDPASAAIQGFSSMGFNDENNALLQERGRDILMSVDCHTQRPSRPLPEFILTFEMDDNSRGMIGLGKKLTGDCYHDEDKELLDTLINNLVIALKNAKSFQEIKSLNKDLLDKNIQLENALNKLQQSIRKVEILESVKENLSKFVPVTVTRMIEKSPTGAILERKRRDISVLFADIEGYTRLCEKLGGKETGTIIEKHFSAFIDAIYRHNGDVNETAGDGLMVLFLNEDEKINAVEAVRAALAIREKSLKIVKECPALYRPLDINMGINSGKALVGAAKFDTLSGSRYTYTAHGSLTNIAARIGAQSTGGKIFLSQETRDRVANFFHLEYMGKFQLKNVSKKVDIYEVNGVATD